MSLLEKPQDDSYLVLFIGQRTILRIPAIFSMERRRRRGLWWKGRRSSWLINRRKGRWNARASERTSRTEWSDESAKGLSLQSGAASCRRGFVFYVFWEFHRLLGCTAAAMLPKQARGTFRKHKTKPFLQVAVPDCTLSDDDIDDVNGFLRRPYSVHASTLLSVLLPRSVGSALAGQRQASSEARNVHPARSCWAVNDIVYIQHFILGFCP